MILAEIKRRVEAGTLQGQADIGLAVGAVWNRYKVKKHFQVTITDDTFTYERKHEQIAQEAELDGIYVIRAGRIDPAQLAAAGIVRAYKQLKEAEKGFGGIKGPLEVRPIHHRLEDRVRSHLLICMLAEYVRWHLRHAWAELLFQDDNPRSNADPVAKATRSPRGDPQGRPPPHPPAGALPHDPEPLRRAREPHPQHDPRQGQRGDLPAAEHPDRAASPRARADQRARPPAHVAKRQTAPNRPESPKTGAKTTVVSRNFGLDTRQPATQPGTWGSQPPHMRLTDVENFARRLPTRATRLTNPQTTAPRGTINAAHLTDAPPYEAPGASRGAALLKGPSRGSSLLTVHSL